MKNLFIPCLVACYLFSCSSKKSVDLVIYNANVYTVDSSFHTAQAFAVRDGHFVAIGETEDIKAQYDAQQTIDAAGKPIYPGFIDAHCHFRNYGLELSHADLVGTESYGEVVAKVVAHRKQYPQTSWILGRGWDQNDWPLKQYPTKDTLDQLFPDIPVFLTRIDGHAALANQKALDLAGVQLTSKVSGGIVETHKGKLTGVLVDNAVDLVSAKIPAPSRDEVTRALQQAATNCLAVGLTTVDDAGLDKASIDLIDSLQKAKQLPIRVYAMLTPDSINKQHYFAKGPYQTDWLTVRSFKVYADGALGSRGACLLSDYHDRPGERGFLLAKAEEYRQLAADLYQHGFQMNTHCIGDSANRFMLDVYGEVLKEKNDRRWRIEHAQVVTTPDLAKFGQFSVIPSVQPTHATSDMYWAADRLGPERVKTAYTFKDLLRQHGRIALGSDFPVEEINPLYGFYAAVVRQDAKRYPAGGFQPENALSREEALRGMTSWAAYSNFEEKSKGSIETGKLADFVILDDDLMKVAPEKLRNVRIRQTFVNGKSVYRQP